MRNWLIYFLFIALGATAVYSIVELGRSHETGPAMARMVDQTTDQWAHFKEIYRENLTHPLAKLLLQILTIIITARIFSFMCRKIGLPSVVGEIAAGIFLGPSFLASYFPEYSAFLFPAESLNNLKFLSQIGLILFMFVVGMELDLKVVRAKRCSSAMAASFSLSRLVSDLATCSTASSCRIPFLICRSPCSWVWP